MTAKNKRGPWSESEVQRLRSLADKFDDAEIGRRLGRSESSVRTKRGRLRGDDGHGIAEDVEFLRTLPDQLERLAARLRSTFAVGPPRRKRGRPRKTI